MSENRDYLEMTFHSINCFADDGKLDVNEINQILAIALKDGVVDDNEKRVLSNIIGRLNEAELDVEMLSKVEEIKTEYLS
ncbi:hypothetical protein A3715_04750 [Oleiphilus sp. HI0009]|uniref:hypothetical protein n=1 Tax=unclassified Oleiphilus TaxID=2631174 RepID=UPI0007C29731|nr:MULTISPECIES: hypothetical protein [unclassified Oleiphilus]KZX83776.1 hypothetical protein A3715_04750 [Oleiphilus sp. HI0009]KZY62821.1 hypothetical protein A3738_20980 [Oleiphilus sp. HI0066]KZY67946.1 hypothetical protein A3739_11500 [Oleiphilus sp. HI0067]KZY71697.1 hypothetical protein A3738_03280 [Oleiphilus sp. HI0066]